MQKWQCAMHVSRGWVWTGSGNIHVEQGIWWLVFWPFQLILSHTRLFEFLCTPSHLLQGHQYLGRYYGEGESYMLILVKAHAKVEVLRSAVMNFASGVMMVELKRSLVWWCWWWQAGILRVVKFVAVKGESSAMKVLFVVCMTEQSTHKWPCGKLELGIYRSRRWCHYWRLFCALAWGSQVFWKRFIPEVMLVVKFDDTSVFTWFSSDLICDCANKTWQWEWSMVVLV